jgi:hypothetical protein
MAKKYALEARTTLEPVVNDKPEEKREKIISGTKEVSEFSANPCNSPSAKFLSTCKK